VLGQIRDQIRQIGRPTQAVVPNPLREICSYSHAPGRIRTCDHRIRSSVSLVILSVYRPLNAGDVRSDHVRFAQAGTRGYPLY
jgi:hypothetical protein